jgi:F-type H+-transporting ATPase subunit epsilon
MATFHLTIVTPAGKPFDGDSEALSAPGEEGSFGILAHHAPMIAGIKQGILSLTRDGSASYWVTGEGVLEVKLGGAVVILADKALPTSGLEEAQRLLAEELS